MSNDLAKLLSKPRSRRSFLEGVGAAAVGLSFSNASFAADKAEEAKLNF